MKTIKEFFIGLFMLLSISGCGLLCKQKQNIPETYGTSMRILYDKEFTYAQFDSICVADAIPINLELWKAYSQRDYETSVIITEYLYIKRLGKNEELYRLMIVDNDKYNIYKRITYADKEE